MDESGWYVFEAPFGNISISCESGLPESLSFIEPKVRGALVESPQPQSIKVIMRSLQDYFSGKNTQISVANGLLAQLSTTPFKEAVLKEVIRIPRGETLSYGEVAELVGRPHAARAVGNVMRSNPYPIIIPCHRVIKSDGSLGGYGGGQRIKLWLLDFEGIKVNSAR
jgi:methylated-DNA-[protein]-cysteine S-methyltransferase